MPIYLYTILLNNKLYVILYIYMCDKPNLLYFTTTIKNQ